MKDIHFVIQFYLLSPFMDLENHSCGHIFCTFKANLIKLHVLVPIRLNRKLNIISRVTCWVKK